MCNFVYYIQHYSMPNKEEILELLKNIQSGLKKFTITELNDAISNIVKDVKCVTDAKEIQYVIQEVCKEFNINKNQLIHSNARGVISQAKSVAYCLLHFELNLPLRYISKKVFFLKHHGSVAVAVRSFKKLNTAIKPDKEFLDKYVKIKNTIKEKQVKTK
jgi:chromosomal replication initiation ATPase DnaA